jgi:hypothetical protein
MQGVRGAFLRHQGLRRGAEKGQESEAELAERVRTDLIAPGAVQVTESAPVVVHHAVQHLEVSHD